MSLQYGELWPTIAAKIDSTNFSGFRVLVALLHDTLVVGVNQTLQR